MEDPIYFFKSVFQFEICVFWRNFHLDDEAVYFVDHNYDRQILSKNVLNDLFCHEHHTFNCIYHEDHSITESHPCNNLSKKIGVSRGVDEVENVVFWFEVLEEESDRGCFDGKLFLLLVDPCIEPSVVFL